MAWSAKAHLQNSEAATLPSQKSQSMPPLSRQWLASSPESLAVRNLLQHNRSQGRTSAVLDRPCDVALDGMTPQHASPISNNNMTSKLLTAQSTWTACIAYRTLMLVQRIAMACQITALRTPVFMAGGAQMTIHGGS